MAPSGSRVPTIETQLIGDEKRPVLIIENFLSEPAALLEQASTADFRPFVRFFPGVQAPFSFEAFETLIDPYLDQICEAFSIGANIAPIECGFALVTTPPAKLSPLQRIPHIDATDPRRLAVLAYISGERFGGTAFYRHKSTGFEYLTEDMITHYNHALDKDVAEHGIPRPAYIFEDTNIFEQIAAFEARPGRALVYASNSLHSGMIKNADLLTSDARAGRLTLNAFLAPGSK